MQEEKKQFRAWAKKLRGILPISSISQQVVKHLQNWETYQNANHILSYLAFGDEINLSVLHEDPSKQFYVTRTHKTHLSIHRLENLEQHPFGYLQPARNAAEVSPELIELVLVPGLCFDKRGYRLGYGKGYYDKFLPTLRQVPLVGITAEALIVDNLPTESFDVAMTHLVTEKGKREKGKGK